MIEPDPKIQKRYYYMYVYVYSVNKENAITSFQVRMVKMKVGEGVRRGLMDQSREMGTNDRRKRRNEKKRLLTTTSILKSSRHLYLSLHQKTHFLEASLKNLLLE